MKIDTPSQPLSARGSARFADPAIIEVAIRELNQLVDEYLQKHGTKLKCPHGRGCEPATCAQAFHCGALQADGSDTQHAFRTAAIWGAFVLVFNVFMIAILFWSASEEDGQIESLSAVTWISLLGTLVVLPAIAAGLIAFVWSCVAGRREQKHRRAVAGAASEAGLSFTGRLRLPETLTSGAFALVCPEGDVTVDVLARGKLAGQSLFLARFEYLVTYLEQTSAGIPLRMIGAAYGKSPQKEWQAYLLTMFPDALDRVPDFVLLPRRALESYYVEMNFGQFEVPLPNPGLGINYQLFAANGNQLAELLPQELSDFLCQLPGWYLQVVGGRLYAWRDSFMPLFSRTLPRSREHLLETIRLGPSRK